MGRITIFALTECPHCNRTKAKLKNLGVPYKEINLSLYPSRRTDMLALTDRLTVPQVFFNDQHIGGADDTLAKIEQIGDFRNYYKNQILRKLGPKNSRLRTPTEPPVPEKPAPSRDQQNSVPMPNGEKWTVLQVTNKLRSILDIRDRRFNLTIYSNCFVGRDAVKVFKSNFDGIDSDEDAIEFGRKLHKLKLLHHVVDDHDFNNEYLFYHLQCHRTPDVLNSFRVWTERVDPDSMALLKRLKKMLDKVESEVTDSEGLVDYKKAATLELFRVFEEAVCELQGVAMDVMDEKMRLAFGINVYNLFIKYAFMKVGIGQRSLARSAFFKGVKMDVGGDILSFNDLENGVLRGNRKPPYTFGVPFANDDKRIRLAMKNSDCRIHFALNCGARSCPAVKSFTAEAIEEELRIVAEAFCEEDENVRVDPLKKTIYLTKILDWYRVDFADSKMALPAKMVEFLRGDRKETLRRMLGSGKNISVEYNRYDWGTNASDCIAFDPLVLKSSRTTVKALLPRQESKRRIIRVE